MIGPTLHASVAPLGVALLEAVGIAGYAALVVLVVRASIRWSERIRAADDATVAAVDERGRLAPLARREAPAAPPSDGVPASAAQRRPAPPSGADRASR